MSTRDDARGGQSRVAVPIRWLRRRTLRHTSPARIGTLLAGAGLIGAYVGVLYEIADITGQTALFYPTVGLALVIATLLSRTVRDRTALAVAGVVFGLGSLWYLAALSYLPGPVGIIGSNFELLSGLSLLRLDAVGRWVIVVTPVVTFLTWFFLLRRRYAAGTGVGAGTLGYLVLTGDAGTTATLLGIVSALALIGLGDLESAGRTDQMRPTDAAQSAGGAGGRGIERLVVVLAIAVVAPLAVTIVPGGAATPLSLVGGDGQTMEDAVVAQDDLEIVGSVDQSPEVRFTVTGDEPRRWRTASFDRYTGDGWVRTGGTDPAVDLDAPPGETRSVSYEVTLESQLETIPVPWRPTAIGNLSTPAVQTETGGLQAGEGLEPGEQYTVTGAVSDASPETLAAAGTDYPRAIVDRYTQLPDSTPDRVADRTADIAADATDPYETAVLVEQWLETNRAYSLDIDRPDGDIADAFLFEMEAGYCTYYATTMVTMLRSQEIPARLAVGYTPGEQVGENQWAVRGLNSHAWVEVYFPGEGWIEFDPTPASPRGSAEQSRLDSAIAADEEGVQPTTVDAETAPEDRDGEQERTDDTVAGDEFEEIGPDPIGDPELEDPEDPIQQLPADVADPGSGTDGGGGGVAGDGDDAGAFSVVTDRPRGQLALGAVVAAGLVAGVRRTNAHVRLAWAVRLRLPRRADDPITDVERAHERLTYVLARRHRERRPGETMRAYVNDIDAGEHARQLVELRERARYGDGISEAEAEEAFDRFRRVKDQ